MRVEQACRFRTEDGRGITARSAGFDSSQESLLGELFSDTMNPIFPELGDSILSCTVKGSYAFYARNTLRSHETRKIIFSHSYIMTAEAYEDAMQRAPERLLSVPMSEFMDIQTCPEDVDALEFPWDRYAPLDVEQLFEKYHLTPERYSRLMVGAYEALTSNRPLMLETSLPLAKTEQMVRELVCCIVDGLPPVLKGQVSFSSGADTRMDICVLHPDGRTAQRGDMVFSVESDEHLNLTPRDELGDAFFEALGRMDRESRRDLLQRMEDWLYELTDISEGLSVMLITMAYAYCSGRQMSEETRMMLFRNITNGAGQIFTVKKANSLLAELVEAMVEEGYVSTNALSIFAEWYLMDSSARFRTATERALALTSCDVCAALIEAVIDLPCNENARLLICALVQLLPDNAPELTAEIREALIKWIIREDVDTLADFLNRELERYSLGQIADQAEYVLLNAANRELNRTEKGVIRNALERLNQAGQVFRPEIFGRLENHIPEFREPDTTLLAEYILQSCVRQYPMVEDQADAIYRIICEHHALRECTEGIMRAAAAGGRNTLLWETYQTNRVFSDTVTGIEVPILCSEHNHFNNPMGPFEKKALSVWVKYVGEEMTRAIGEARGVQSSERAATRHLDETSRIRFSSEAREYAKQFICSKFWELITFEHILNSNSQKTNVAFALKVKNTYSEFKLPLLEACGRMRTNPNPETFGGLVRLIRGSELPAKELEDLQDILPKLAWKIIKDHRIVGWDLLLMSSWIGGDEYDYDRLNDLARLMQENIDQANLKNVKSTAAGSFLLQSRTLRKTVAKKLDSLISDVPPIADTLILDLKSGKIPTGKGASAGKSSTDKPKQPSQPESGRRGGTGSGSGQGKNPFTEETSSPQESGGWFSGLFGKGKNKK